MNLISRIGMMIANPKRVFPFVKEEKTRKAWVYLLFVLFFANIPFLVLGIIVFSKYFAPIFKDLSIVVFWIAFISSILTVPNIALVLAIILGTLVF